MNHFNRQVKTFNNFLQLLSDLRYSEAMATSEGPRWFDAGERSSWLALIGVVARLGPALDAQLRRAAGVTFFEYTVLAVLSEAPDHMLRMSELAALAEGSLSRLSQAVARMEATGWVRRMPDPEDGRYTLAILTDDGMGKVAASAPEHVEEVRRLVFDPLAKAQTRQLAPPSGIASSRPSTPGPPHGRRRRTTLVLTRGFLAIMAAAGRARARRSLLPGVHSTSRRLRSGLLVSTRSRPVRARAEKNRTLTLLSFVGVHF